MNMLPDKKTNKNTLESDDIWEDLPVSASSPDFLRPSAIPSSTQKSQSLVFVPSQTNYKHDETSFKELHSEKSLFTSISSASTETSFATNTKLPNGCGMIELRMEKDLFVGGDPIRGSLVLFVWKEFVATQLRTRLRGRERTLITETFNTTEVVHHHEKNELFDQFLILQVFNQGPVAVGTYTYPIQYYLPFHIPGVFYYSQEQFFGDWCRAEISYKLKVFLEGFHFDSKTTETRNAVVQESHKEITKMIESVREQQIETQMQSNPSFEEDDIMETGRTSTNQSDVHETLPAVISLSNSSCHDGVSSSFSPSLKIKENEREEEGSQLVLKDTLSSSISLSQRRSFSSTKVA
eukprot:TRINITY_DN6238_c0_g1_i1.p1 TRINITY_DN6238_c0_g1~~TRINITY_DN6238_c0_g1_i1.p1  ORF type:complete len:351 (-),score=68.11 TRINITY_DN6238_c0_g1_i1:820-1872(-)